MAIEPKNKRKKYNIGSRGLFYLAIKLLGVTVKAATLNKAIDTASFSIDYPRTSMYKVFGTSIH